MHIINSGKSICPSMTRGESKYIFNDSPAAIPGKWKRTILKRNHDTFDVM